MKNLFSVGILEGCANIEYSSFLSNSHHCFGSMNLKKKNYCILNKQYTKEEYEKLVLKVRAHTNEMPYVDEAGRTYRYGEFFPMNLSPFAYNETVAYEYFPMSEQEARRRGLAWNTYASGSNDFSGYIIPDNIRDVRDDILEKILKCELSDKAYRLIPMELAFCRRFNLPIPRLSPFERHRQRLRFVSEHLKLHSRTCGKCDRSVESVYQEEEHPIVYCEQCYNAEVV